LFETSWTHDAEEQTHTFVARFVPDPAAVPVFPTYDLERQARVMEIVRETTGLPVPVVRWWEPDATVAGTPFFVMDRITGQVPPDLMPYNMIGWLTEASAEQRRRLQDASV